MTIQYTWQFLPIWLTPLVFTPRVAKADTVPFTVSTGMTSKDLTCTFVEHLVTVAELKSPTIDRISRTLTRMTDRRSADGMVTPITEIVTLLSQRCIGLLVGHFPSPCTRSRNETIVETFRVTSAVNVMLWTFRPKMTMRTTLSMTPNREEKTKRHSGPPELFSVPKTDVRMPHTNRNGSLRKQTVRHSVVLEKTLLGMPMRPRTWPPNRTFIVVRNVVTLRKPNTAAQIVAPTPVSPFVFRNRETIMESLTLLLTVTVTKMPATVQDVLIVVNVRLLMNPFIIIELATPQNRRKRPLSTTGSMKKSRDPFGPLASTLHPPSALPTLAKMQRRKLMLALSRKIAL